MESFPPSINRMYCINALNTNQTLLLLDLRKSFTDLIFESLEKSQKSVLLEFDKKIWPSTKSTIIKELLERFGEIKIISKTNKLEITTITTLPSFNPDNITNDTVGIVIEFIN